MDVARDGGKQSVGHPPIQRGCGKRMGGCKESKDETGATTKKKKQKIARRANEMAEAAMLRWSPTNIPLSSLNN